MTADDPEVLARGAVVADPVLGVLDAAIAPIADDVAVSERRACQVMDVDRSSMRYRRVGWSATRCSVVILAGDGKPACGRRVWRRYSGDCPDPFRVSADLSRCVREQSHHAALIRGCIVGVVSGGLQMGMLDKVIAAALGSRGQAPQGQTGQRQPAQGQFSQIAAAALTALLAPRPGAAPGPAGQQGPSSGLEVLINQFKQNGLEDVIKSWIGTGKNQPISPPQLRQALGQERVNDLSRQTGAPQDDLLSQLSKYLPGVIDKLTPNGQLPNEADLQSRYRRN